jgi:hypothetical protein
MILTKFKTRDKITIFFSDNDKHSTTRNIFNYLCNYQRESSVTKLEPSALHSYPNTL